jgi:hypothetical protein
MPDRPIIAPNALPRAIRIESPKVARPITTLILGPCYGAMLHYRPNRSPLLCLGADCAPATHKLNLSWKGYLPAELWVSQEEEYVPCVLEVTSHAEHQLAQRKLRGELWMWIRDGSTNKAPMVGKYLERFAENECGEVFDLAPILSRFYRVPRLPESLPNPVPPQTIVTARTGRAPALHVHQQTVSAPPEPLSQEDFKTLRERMGQGIGRPNGRAPR